MNIKAVYDIVYDIIVEIDYPDLPLNRCVLKSNLYFRYTGLSHLPTYIFIGTFAG